MGVYAVNFGDNACTLFHNGYKAVSCFMDNENFTLSEVFKSFFFGLAYHEMTVSGKVIYDSLTADEDISDKVYLHKICRTRYTKRNTGCEND